MGEVVRLADYRDAPPSTLPAAVQRYCEAVTALAMAMAAYQVAWSRMVFWKPGDDERDGLPSDCEPPGAA